MDVETLALRDQLEGLGIIHWPLLFVDLSTVNGRPVN